MDTPLSTFITELRAGWEALHFDKIAIIIFNPTTKQVYDIKSLGEVNGVLWIVYDEEHKTSPLEVDNAYYCDSIEDLRTITNFVTENPEVYYDPDYSRDALNNKTLSLDELAGKGYMI